ncbi:hypothetical protein [Streptomyces sp. NPDC000410]|uniref:hypothetical protein n=1 Tax=Streptomyces sp. NPDC000410 TaxID=3154254 RepID=UPI00332298A9
MSTLGLLDHLDAALAALRAAVTRWRVRHLLLVERMIGDGQETDGTDGLAHLRSLIVLPPRDQVP